MDLRRSMLVLLPLVLACGIAHATPPSATSPDQSAIRGVLHAQVDAWNRGDIPAFMQGYQNSPDTTFVGKTVAHGFASILTRYQEKYSSKEQMGQLAFDGIEIRLLDPHVATVTGRFHLARSAAAGGDAAGVFSLVFESTAAGWKIVLDHTS